MGAVVAASIHITIMVSNSPWANKGYPGWKLTAFRVNGFSTTLFRGNDCK